MRPSCGAEAAGSPLVTAYTAPDGTFTLTGVPVGSAIPLVIQLGRWRRQFTVPISTSCGANSVPDKTLEMPRNHTQGDIPRIGVLTGGFDPVECVLRKIGIDYDSEFSDPGGAGHIQFYTANDPNSPAPGLAGRGAVIDSSTPGQDALFPAPTGGPAGAPQINNYDMVILECEGYPEPESAHDQSRVAAYAAAGGRVFASDYEYSWLYQNPALSASANWDVNQNGGGSSVTGVIDQPPSNPAGTAFQDWLQDVGVSSVNSERVSIDPAFHNTDVG